MKSVTSAKYSDILIKPKRVANITLAAEAELPTEFGTFSIVGFLEHDTGKEHSAIIKGDISGKENVPCRIHSECHTGDVLGSLRCDCRSQLEKALRYIDKKEFGVVLYLRQEGRGIGLINKINAYRLQQEGLDTVEANEELGLPADVRKYTLAGSMLELLDVKSIKLLSNNPAKFHGLQQAGVQIRGRIPITSTPNRFNRRYLKTKEDKMNHSYLDSGDLLLPDAAMVS